MGGGGRGGGEWYLLHFKPLQKLSVSPRLTLCLLSAGYRRRRVIKHGSRQRRAAERKKSRLNNTEFAATDGQDGYNEARRCQRTAPDWWDWCLRGGQGVRRKNEAEAAFAARLFATSCLRSSCPNCCLAWRLRSLGTPFMPPLITSARKERDCYCHYSR